MIVLKQYAPRFGIPNSSPFCLKMEAYLRMAAVEYEVQTLDDPRKTPNGKLPLVKIDGEWIPDSAVIINTLRAKGIADLDAHLHDEQRAISLAFHALLEDRLYWALVFARWFEADSIPVIRDQFFDAVPKLMRNLVFKSVQKKLRRDAYGHGLMFHKPAQIYAFAEQDLAALSAYLGDKPYMMGEQVSSLDASAYGTLANILLATHSIKLTPIADKYPNLRAYTERMREQYWG